MYSVTGLFDTLVDLAHLERAATLTVRGKRRRADVAWFLFRREEVLAGLSHTLARGRYEPEGFELLYLRDPKPRVIARAPIEDRVVHTALVMLMEPVLTRGLMPEAFACRPGFGTHRAVLRLQELMRRHRFCVHLDVRSYFPSIDLDILRGLLRRRIRDRRFLAVVDTVLRSGAGLYDAPNARAWSGMPLGWPPPGRGLPIGALTSQLFAGHVYLGALDHHVKRVLKVPGYVRYIDDFFCFGDRRADLRRWREGIGRFLSEERHLRLKHPRARVLSCGGHLDALGYRITREDRRALPRVARRLQRRVAQVMDRPPGDRRGPDFRRSLAATAGVMLF